LSRIGAAYLLLAVTFTAAAAAAQDPGTPLPLSRAIRTGTLPNGLTFFIRQNAQPEKRVLLQLAVKAGSVDEADDQRGLAHLLEHMAFNGSTHFKPGELVKYLESIGSRFGPDVNAYTGFDETVYMLEVPIDREGVLKRGFEALSDFAGGMTLDVKEIDRERGVVIEEWRLGQGAGSRMQAEQMEGLFGRSRYVDRIPIGLPEILKSFPAERLRDFYKEHYRADRMAVIVVGDIDPVAIEATIREHFSALPTLPPAARAVHPIPSHQETRYVAVSDREAQSSSVSIVHKRQLQQYLTVGDYRRSVVEGLVNQMLDARFAEIAVRADAPFLRATSGDQMLGRTVEGFTISGRVRDGGVQEGIRALSEEIARVRQHGFGEAELERARRSTLAVYERVYNERDKSQSAGFASELVRHFLTAEPAPGIAFELDLVRTVLPQITTAEVNALARELLGEDSRVVIATSPEKDGRCWPAARPPSPPGATKVPAGS
jgi:zinc protease